MSLEIVPITLKEANDSVAWHHWRLAVDRQAQAKGRPVPAADEAAV